MTLLVFLDDIKFREYIFKEICRYIIYEYRRYYLTILIYNPCVFKIFSPNFSVTIFYAIADDIITIVWYLKIIWFWHFDFLVSIPIGDSVAIAQTDFVVRPSREGGAVMLVDLFKNWSTVTNSIRYVTDYDSVFITNPKST